VIIPTRNGGGTFEETLRSVLSQRLEDRFEVIVIDSASTDGTPEAAERILADPVANVHGVHGGVVRIRLQDFGHGRTRNLGCSMAKGEFVAFLSQDATPIGMDWLGRLLQSFGDAAVSGTFCRQVPRAGARLPERFLLAQTYPATSSTRTQDSVALRDAGYILFSNAASAVRRTALLGHPFDEQRIMCEDAEWAVRMLAAGGTIAYVAETSVTHSHGYTLRSIFARNFDYAISLKGLPGSMGPRSYVRYLRQEIAFARVNGDGREIAGTALFEIARCIGYALGMHAQRLPRWLCRRLSGYSAWFSGTQPALCAREACSQTLVTGTGGVPADAACPCD
jgi:rhamnosyltransferase